MHFASIAAVFRLIFIRHKLLLLSDYQRNLRRIFAFRITRSRAITGSPDLFLISVISVYQR